MSLVEKTRMKFVQIGQVGLVFVLNFFLLDVKLRFLLRVVRCQLSQHRCERIGFADSGAASRMPHAVVRIVTGRTAVNDIDPAFGLIEFLLMLLLLLLLMMIIIILLRFV